MKDFCEKFSADVTRLTLANAGDSLDDANIEIKSADMMLLRLSTLENWLKELTKSFESLREDSTGDSAFFDSVFESEIKRVTIATEKAFESMVFRDVIKEAFFNMQHIREEYKFNCGNAGFNKKLVKFYVETQLLLLYPLVPHFSEIMWIENYLPLLGEEELKSKTKFISHAKFPVFKVEEIDRLALKKNDYLKRIGKNLRASSEKILKKKKDIKIQKITFIVAKEFQEWQLKALNYLKGLKFEEGKSEPVGDWKKDVKEMFKEDPKLTKKAMEFTSFKLKERDLEGADAFDSEISFNEKEFIEKYIPLILKDAVEIEQQAVIYSDEAVASGDKNLTQNVESCLPGNPLIVFDVK